MAMDSFLTMSGTTLSDAEQPSRADDSDAVLRMDEEAFRAFYERTARPVWAYLSRLTGDPHTADDLLQEAYYRFLPRRHGVRVGVAPPALALPHRHEPGPRSQPAQTPSSEAPMPEETVDRHSHNAAAEHRTDLGRALSQLPESQRELLWLAYGQGFSHEEIASVTGVKRGEVKDDPLPHPAETGRRAAQRRVHPWLTSPACAKRNCSRS